MHDQGDVRLVYAQPEGLGRHHHIDLAMPEGVLGVLSFGVVHGAAVGTYPVPEDAQQR